jgi:hypothetical protein
VYYSSQRQVWACARRREELAEYALSRGVSSLLKTNRWARVFAVGKDGVDTSKFGADNTRKGENLEEELKKLKPRKEISTCCSDAKPLGRDESATPEAEMTSIQRTTLNETECLSLNIPHCIRRLASVSVCGRTCG